MNVEYLKRRTKMPRKPKGEVHKVFMELTQSNIDGLEEYRQKHKKDKGITTRTAAVNYIIAKELKREGIK